MLTNDELKDICQKNGLTRGEVFKIKTQFSSMVKMSDTWVHDQKQAP
jgi:hypothetical protein